MMTQKIIQFGQLEELLAEHFDPNQVIRVMVLETSEKVSTQIPDWRQVSIGLHIRTINSVGHVLACYLPVATVELYNGRRECDPTWQKYDSGWEQAEALKERVIVYLQEAAAEKGIAIRSAGVIDLGEIRPLCATWKADPALASQR